MSLFEFEWSIAILADVLFLFFAAEDRVLKTNIVDQAVIWFAIEAIFLVSLIFDAIFNREFTFSIFQFKF